MVAVSASPIAGLLDCNRKLRKQIADHSGRLLRSIGRINVLNYEDALREPAKKLVSLETNTGTSAGSSKMFGEDQ